MLVLPLGLGTRLKRRPVVTVLMAVLWTLWFVGDRSDSAILSELFTSVAETGVRDSARKLFVDYCKSRKGQQKTCDRYSMLVWTGFPGREHLTALRNVDEVDESAMKSLLKEHDKAEKARGELADCGDSLRCFAYKDIVWQFLERSRDGGTGDLSIFANLSALPLYKKAISTYRKSLRDICREHACLVSSNINAASLAAAQLRHGGFMHLFSNLFVLIVFGIYVEQRTNRLAYLVSLVIGGTIGMATHAAFFSSGDTLALGGSANVSAVMGMFFIFFLRQRMSFLVWIPRRLYFGTIFRAPVMLCFPIIFILSDITGGFDSGFSELTSSRVAHFAHLAGLLFGMVAATAIVAWRRLPAPFIYETEMADMLRLERGKDPKAMLTLASEMVRYNPENVHAMEVGCSAFLRWANNDAAKVDAEFQESGRSFLAQHLDIVCSVNARKNSLGYAARILGQVPMSMPYRDLLGRLGQVNVLRLADFAASEGHPVLGIRIYDFFLMRFSHSKKCQSVFETAMAVLASLPRVPMHRALLEGFALHHPHSPMLHQVNGWIVTASPAVRDTLLAVGGRA